MTQQTFSVGRNPQVIISQVDASLRVQACQEQVISVETAAPSVALLQEGDKLIIMNCQGDLALRVPALKNSNISIATDITAIHLSGNVTIEGAGQVKLKEIGGNVILKDIAGDTELENIHGTAHLTDLFCSSMETSSCWVPHLYVACNALYSLHYQSSGHLENQFRQGWK